MIEFIDETAENEGTPINRANMMAVQGFVGMTTTFYPNAKDDDGIDHNVKKVNSMGETLYIDFNSDNTMTKTLIGAKTIKVKTTFDGAIIATLEE